MNLFSDVAIAFSLYLLAIFISKFWEKPVVWVLENFVFPELKKAFELLKDPGLWVAFDKYLKEHPLTSFNDAIDDTRLYLGMEWSSGWAWGFVRRRMRQQFNIDAHRKYIAQEPTS